MLMTIVGMTTTMVIITKDDDEVNKEWSKMSEMSKIIKLFSSI